MNKKISIVLSSLILCSLLSGCNSWFIPKDTLNEVTNTSTQETQFLGINVLSYKQQYEGTVLCYDASLDMGLYTLRTNVSSTDISYLYLFDTNGATLLFSGSNTYTEGAIDPYDSSIYFKEYDASTLSASVYKTTKSAQSKITMTQESVNKQLAWSVCNGELYYINSDNNLIRTDGTTDNVEHSFDSEITIKKMVCSATDNIIFYTSVSTQKASVLSRMDMENYESSAIDVNVTDFVVNDMSQSVIYIKTAGAHDQLYSYNIPTFMRNYMLTNDIEKIAVSYTGSYIAYVTKVTSELPSQSVWITTSSGDMTAQVTANIILSGNMVFTDSSKLMFSVASTDSSTKETKETVYNIMLLQYELDYIKDQN